MRLTTNIFIEKAKCVHGDKYDYSQVVYSNMKTKVRIICPIHGVFEQTPDKHLHGKCGCPMCAGNVKSNTAEFCQKALAIHGGKYDYRYVNYVNNKTSVEIMCPEHGVFTQTPTNHLKGKGCPICANNVLLSQESFIKKAKAVHGDKYNYDNVIYKGNHVPVIISCKLHGLFSQLPYVHLSGSGCPLCGYVDRVLHRDSELAHKNAVKTFLARYGVDNPMKDANIYARQKHAVASNETRKKRIDTKRINNSFNTSLPERRLQNLLESIFGKGDVFDNYVSERYPFKCDFYIKSRDMYIELNAHWSHGGHWYDDVVDKDVVSQWLQKSAFYKNAAQTFSMRDVKKRKVAKQNRLNYIVFWDTGLSDVQQWISLGCPDGQDWLVEYSWLK